MAIVGFPMGEKAMKKTMMTVEVVMSMYASAPVCARSVMDCSKGLREMRMS